MTTRIYARVSTSDQTCEHQLTELRRWAMEQGAATAVEYVDAGVSGSTRNRPELKRLMTDVKRGDVVVVYKLDRFGRSVLHLTQLLDDLEKRGVRFVVTSQAMDTGSASATTRFQMHMLAAVAEFERELIRERTQLGVRAAIAAGKSVGRPRKVFRRDEAARMRSDGLSWREIAEKVGAPVTTVTEAVRGRVRRVPLESPRRCAASPFGD